MNKFLFFMILFFITSVQVKADLEDQLMGTVELDEDEILAPLSQDDELYLKAVDISEEQMEEFKGEEFPEIDFTQINELRQKDEENIVQIIKSAPASKLTFYEKEALKVQLKDIIQSGTFLATIKKGTKLVHVRTGRLHYNQRTITVRAYKLKDYEGYQLLKNKNGYISYKALSKDVINITEVTKMHERPLKYVPIKKQIKYDLNNEDIKYQSQFLVNFGLTRPIFLRDIINSQDHFGQTMRYEATGYGRWKFPIKTGFTVQWENNYGNFDNGKYNMYTLSLGPSFKSMPFKIFDTEYLFIAQTRLAIFSKIDVVTRGSTANYNNSQTNLTLGLVREIKTDLGKFLYGFNFQRQWLKPSAIKTSLDINSENNYNDAIAISVGHGSDWIW